MRPAKQKSSLRAGLLLSLVLGLLLVLAACGQQINEANKSVEIKPLATLPPTYTPVPPTALPNYPVGLFGANQINAQIVGGGSTRLQFLTEKWFAQYQKVAPNVKLSYQVTNSGSGQSAFLGTPVPQGSFTFVPSSPVDFSASDFTYTSAQLQEIVRKGEVVHIPVLVGAVVVTYRLDGFQGDLKLSPATLAKIFLGQIKEWNSPEIQAENSNALPAKPIKVVIRDRKVGGSGTNELFSRYLSSINDEIRTKVGIGTQLNWPQFGQLEGANGSAVSGIVRDNDGAIGYVDQEQADAVKLKYALLRNRSGQYVAATPQNLAQAADSAAIPDDFRSFILDPVGATSYPIAGFTWLLVWKDLNNMPNPAPEKAQALLHFLWWTLHDGQATENFPANFAPLPKSLVQRLEGLFINTNSERVIKFKGNPVFTAPKS